MSNRAIVPVLFVGIFAATLATAEVKHDLRVALSLSGNSDDNIFRTADRETSGNFAWLSLDFRYKHDLNKLIRFDVELDVEHEAYEKDFDNGDATDFHARFGSRFTPLKRRWRWIRVTPTVFLDRVDKVFNSRFTGDEISGEQDRFDYDQTGVDLEVEFRRSKLFEIGTRLQAKQKDYKNDFSDDLLTDSLDYDEYRANAYATWRRERSDYTIALEYRNREYDEKFPRASDGTEVLPFFPPGASEKPYEPSRYTYRIAELVWRRELTPAWRIKSGFQLVDRSDEFLSYMDYRSQDYDFRVFADFGKRWKFYGSLSYEDIRYDNARVDFDPEEPLKRVAYTRALVRLTYAPWARTSVFISYRLDDEYNRDPDFDYTRQRLGVGVSHRFY